MIPAISQSQTFLSSVTVDVEDGINIAMRDHFQIEMPPTERVIFNTEKLLDIFEEYRIKATFFILGEVSTKFPQLVNKIASAGHEIGVHGFTHDKLFNLTPQKAKEEISKAKKILEDLTGDRIYGYRAPAFSLIPETRWIFEILNNLEFLYDSSIIPAKMGRYGWSGFEKDIIRINMADDTVLYEAPLSIVKVMGRNIPACGGGYLRYFPLSFTKWAFRSIVKRRPVIIYLHPYEIDNERYPDYFYASVKNAPFKKKISLLLYRYKKGSVIHKLSEMLNQYEFIPLVENIKRLGNEGKLKSLSIHDLISK